MQPVLEDKLSALQRSIDSQAEVAANLAAHLAALRQDTSNYAADLKKLISGEVGSAEDEAASIADLVKPAQEISKTAALDERVIQTKKKKEITIETLPDEKIDKPLIFNGCIPGQTATVETPQNSEVDVVPCSSGIAKQHSKVKFDRKGSSSTKSQQGLERADSKAKSDFDAFVESIEKGDVDTFWAGRVFADPEDLKEQIRSNLSKRPYDVRNFYHETGIFQLIARSPKFEAMSIFIVSLNSLWISVDLDFNAANNLSEADAIFQIAAHVFCLYFCAEQLVRFLAFKHKMDATRDFWFVFDFILVFAIVLDTWIMTAILSLLASDSSSGSPRTLVVFRIFRLFRVVRLVRVLRTIPEVVVILRGIGIALRAILVVLVLIGFIIYIAAIVLRVVLEDTAVGAKHCSSIPSCMGVLLLDATLSGAKGVPMMYEANAESFFFSVLIFIFVLFANITCMGVLSGLLVQTVKTVAECEKEEKQVKSMQLALEHVWDLITLHDEDGDGLISHEELQHMFRDANTARLLQKMDVDLEGVITVAGFVLDSAGGTLSKTAFKQMILDLRNKNVAKVKDLVETRKFVHEEFKRAGFAFSHTPSAFIRRLSGAFTRGAPSQTMTPKPPSRDSW